MTRTDAPALGCKELGLHVPDSPVPEEFREAVRKRIKEADEFVRTEALPAPVPEFSHPRQRWNRYLVVIAFQDFYRMYDRLPKKTELKEIDWLPSWEVVWYHYGGIYRAALAAGLPYA